MAALTSTQRRILIACSAHGSFNIFYNNGYVSYGTKHTERVDTDDLSCLVQLGLIRRIPNLENTYRITEAGFECTRKHREH